MTISSSRADDDELRQQIERLLACNAALRSEVARLLRLTEPGPHRVSIREVQPDGTLGQELIEPKSSGAREWTLNDQELREDSILAMHSGEETMMHCDERDEEIARLREENEMLDLSCEHLSDMVWARDKEIERLRKGIRAVNGLIHESRGVTGLHLNGDVAMWDDLLRGGKYEEWLLDFSAACEAGGADE